MTKVLFGDRLGRNGKLRLGCSATLFDPTYKKILLTRRTDNGDWCLPGGGVEPGESVAEAAERETWEETGLRVGVIRLVGVYSNPHQLIEYADGNKAFIVALNFEVRLLGGAMALSNETTDIGFFTLQEIEDMKLLGNHKQRIQDAIEMQDAAFIR
jgi:8-oxo-dGTP pyrophosphatase MutT (NUDIX family)